MTPRTPRLRPLCVLSLLVFLLGRQQGSEVLAWFDREVLPHWEHARALLPIVLLLLAGGILRVASWPRPEPPREHDVTDAQWDNAGEFGLEVADTREEQSRRIARDIEERAESAPR